MNNIPDNVLEDNEFLPREDTNEIPPHLIHVTQTIVYDVINVNVFPLKFMRFLPQKYG